MLFLLPLPLVLLLLLHHYTTIAATTTTATTTTTLLRSPSPPPLSLPPSVPLASSRYPYSPSLSVLHLAIPILSVSLPPSLYLPPSLSLHLAIPIPSLSVSVPLVSSRYPDSLSCHPVRFSYSPSRGFGTSSPSPSSHGELLTFRRTSAPVLSRPSESPDVLQGLLMRADCQPPLAVPPPCSSRAGAKRPGKKSHRGGV